MPAAWFKNFKQGHVCCCLTCIFYANKHATIISHEDLLFSYVQNMVYNGLAKICKVFCENDIIAQIYMYWKMVVMAPLLIKLVMHFHSYYHRCLSAVYWSFYFRYYYLYILLHLYSYHFSIHLVWVWDKRMQLGRVLASLSTSSEPQSNWYWFRIVIQIETWWNLNREIPKLSNSVQL